MKTTAVKGMNDYLPNEVALREYMQRTIQNIYQSYGYQKISTPAVEDAENLDKSDGGDNLNLIFKIMKRGEKLTAALSEQRYDDLSDLGLRYDLTLPLCRYYAAHRNQLMFPMKCIQVDKVYRAERPQKGRLREFIQCDIDIIGSSAAESEIELISVTAEALLTLGFANFTVVVNDRGILNAVLRSLGFAEEALASVCVSFDKLDKIGAAGVAAELTEKGFAADAISKFTALLEKLPHTVEAVKSLCPDTALAEKLERVIREATALADGKYAVEFDLSLVRGQGYYTGTIFEIRSNDFGSSIAGGGRYDNLIGKFIGEEIPAVGFSIGFERIFSLMLQNNMQIPNRRKQLAVLFEEDFLAANAAAASLRKEYDVTVMEKPKKVGKLLSKLEQNGFDGFVYAASPETIKFFTAE